MSSIDTNSSRLKHQTQIDFKNKVLKVKSITLDSSESKACFEFIVLKKIAEGKTNEVLLVINEATKSIFVMKCFAKK